MFAIDAVKPRTPKISRMSRDALKTLFHPFASGTLGPARRGRAFLFLGAEAGQRCLKGLRSAGSAVQPLRSYLSASCRSGAQP
jgi:16S rRNA (guanine1207-N2)-methyltransferase